MTEVSSLHTKQPECAWVQYSLILENNIDRDGLVTKLKEKSINVAIFYPNVLHQQECFKYLEYDQDAFNVASDVSNHIINLPCYGELSYGEQTYIIDTFCELIKSM